MTQQTLPPPTEAPPPGDTRAAGDGAAPRGAAPERPTSPARRWRGVIETLGLLLVAVVFLLPYLWMFLSSFKPDEDIFAYAYPLSLWTFVPPRPTLANYAEVLVAGQFWRYFLNSVVVALSLVLLSLVVNSLAAFAFARLDFPGKELVFVLVIATLLVPFEATLIPLFLVVRDLKLNNTLPALVLPFVASPIATFLLRQFFAEIPRELDDAAAIDGCSTLGIYWHVILPNATPALLTTALITFLFSWDAFFWPLIAIQRPELQVVQVAIATLNTPERVFWGQTFAVCVLASLPVALVFLFLQRYYVRGVTLSGMK